MIGTLAHEFRALELKGYWRFMFDTLNTKFEKIVQSIRGKAVISETDLEVTLREIRIALLEADVSLVVVKEFINSIKSNILGKEILKSVKPDQMIIKLVQDELVKILGSENKSLNLSSSQLTKILFCGLQGSGKTTSIAKLSYLLKKSSKKKILLASADIYRPAAQEQLKVLAEETGSDFFNHNLSSASKIVDDSIDYAQKNLFDILILDTAGRQVVDKMLMSELIEIENKFKPDETLLVADALTGQDAANVAKSFSDAINITGSILTRIDGDSRGGAALSIKSITNSPIKFIGLGEKVENFEPFHPERIAQRILGMGDIVSLVEKAAENIDKEEMEDMAKKIAKGKFDLEDFANQLKQMGKMGGVSGLLSMMPGVSKAQKLMAENKLIAGTEGNISGRSSNGNIIMTPSGYDIGDISEDMLVELDIEYRELAVKNGASNYIRIPTVGTNTDFIRGLAKIVKDAGNQSPGFTNVGGELCDKSCVACPLL